MKATKVFEVIALSILLLITALTAAVAQGRLISGLYGTEEKISPMTPPRPAGEPERRGKKERPKGELSAAQWVEVVRVAEGLLGLPGSRKSAAATLAAGSK